MLDSVVQRHMVRVACRVAYDQTPKMKKAHASDLSLEAIQVIAKHLTANSRQDFTERKAFMSIVKKVKKLITLFKKAPQAWDKFKAMLGVKATNAIAMVKEIDTKLGNLLEEGKKKLAQASKKILKELPLLRLVGEVLEEQNRWEDLINQYKDYVPDSVKSALAKIERGTTKLGEFLDGILGTSRTLKALSAPIKIYLFFQIWDWFADFDFRAVVAGLLGTISFSDLMAMLPGEGIEIILELILPPPTNGALVKLVTQVGVSSVFAVVLVLEVKYLMKLHKVKSTRELLVRLEANDPREEYEHGVIQEDIQSWPQRST